MKKMEALEHQVDKVSTVCGGEVGCKLLLIHTKNVHGRTTNCSSLFNEVNKKLCLLHRNDFSIPNK